MRSRGLQRGIGAIWVLAMLFGVPMACAQEVAAEQTVVDDDLLSDADLEKLLAPVALYPDTLLTQILLAATYPLDVVKAGRFVDANADTPDKDRAALAEEAGWDPSVQTLAAGFPGIVTRMNDHLDWTEQVGDALLAQPDDVLDTVQRLRDDAAATGYLTTNDAQTVIVNADDTITIAPTNPQVVYVPAYDPQVVYTQPAPVTNPVYVDSGSGTDFGDVLATGAIVFGTAMILDNIFDNDDPWDDYWRGPPQVDWSNNDFRPRPGVNVDGDVNIGSNNTVNRINRETTRGDRTNVAINRDTVNLDRSRTDIDRTRIGSVDRASIDNSRQRTFNPDDLQRAEARDKIAARKAEGGAVATLPATTRPRTEGASARVADAKASGKLNPARVNTPVAANRPAKVDHSAAAQRAQNVTRPSAAARPAKARAPQKTSAFEKSGGARAQAAANRGKASAGQRRN